MTAVYEYDDDEVDILGWETFVVRQWELIFAGYAGRAGLRRNARRWADLLMGGGNLPLPLADDLVRAAVLDRPDLAPEDARDLDEIRTRMLDILDAMLATYEAEARLLAPGDAYLVPTLAEFLRRFASNP